MPTIYIIAGANGSGKTTAAMIERLNQLLKEKKSFAFETTLSGLSYLQFIKLAKDNGYK